MKRILPLLFCLLLLTGCGGNDTKGAYEQITQETAKEMMDTREVIILDVREQDEYDSGHIPGAVLLPVGSIDEDTAAEVIPEKDSTVLVYCRPKFCVTAKSGANREKFIMGGRRVKRLPPC